MKKGFYKAYFFVVGIALATITLHNYSAEISDYKKTIVAENCPFDFVTFEKYTTYNSAYLSTIKPPKTDTLAIYTPFPYKEVPSNTHLHQLEEGTKCSISKAGAEIITCGPNSPCDAVVATTDSSDKIITTHKHYTTNHNSCAETIVNEFPDNLASEIKVLVYSVEMKSKEYENDQGSRSWLTLHGKNTQVEDIKLLASALEKNGIAHNNITIALVKKQKNRFTKYITDVLIDPSSQDSDNPWKIYNTSIHHNLSAARTKILFSLRDSKNKLFTKESLDTSLSNEHFLCAQKLAEECAPDSASENKKNHFYNSLSPVHAQTIHCGQCEKCPKEDIRPGRKTLFYPN